MKKIVMIVFVFACRCAGWETGNFIGSGYVSEKRS